MTMPNAKGARATLVALLVMLLAIASGRMLSATQYDPARELATAYVMGEMARVERAAAMADAASAPVHSLVPRDTMAALLHALQDTLLSARQERQMLGWALARIDNTMQELQRTRDHMQRLWNAKDAQVRHDSIAKLPPGHDTLPPPPPDPIVPDSVTLHPDSSDIDIGGTVQMWVLQWHTHPVLGPIPTVCGYRTDTGAQGYWQVTLGLHGELIIGTEFLESPCDEPEWVNDTPDIARLDEVPQGPPPPGRDTVPARVTLADITLDLGDSMEMPLQLWNADSVELDLPGWSAWLLDPRPHRNDVVVVDTLTGRVHAVRPGTTTKMCASLLGTRLFVCARATVHDTASAPAATQLRALRERQRRRAAQ